MPRLIEASEEQVRSILEESWSIWGAGLDPDDYRAFWDELRRTDWARENLRYRVWVDDDGAVLSSVKVYRPAARWLGRTMQCAVFGAVFTPARRRGRGHAAAMLRRAIDEAGMRGDGFVLLFSDIDPGYYDALGFAALPAEEAVGTIRRVASGPVPPPRGWSLRPMGVADLAFVARVHRRSSARYPLALDRTPAHWGFLWKRAESFFRRLDGSGLEGRYSVVLEDGRPAGYLVSVEGGREWHLREAAADGDSDARLGAVLRTGALAAYTRGRRTVIGWMPRRYDRIVPDWRLSWRPRGNAVPMVRPLLEEIRIEPLLDPDRGHVPYLDQF